MREIKFRGFTKNEEKFGNGKDGWVYGNLSVLDNGTIDIQDINDGNCFKAVFEESVGQYTGLKDKNGAEIYEGDIVYIASEDENAFVLWDKETARYIIQFRGWCADFDNFYGKDLEVIRNIYDNKNLLEEVGEEL